MGAFSTGNGPIDLQIAFIMLKQELYGFRGRSINIYFSSRGCN